jgi:dTDP-4-dehydrorhamnose 3,5-epimerase
VLDVVPTAIADVLILTPRRIQDGRGLFCEVYSEQRFAEVGVRAHFVQDNLSVSAQAGTVRGLHFQAPPFAQDKLVRVGRGRILDIAVDIRRSSPTYGRHVSIELSAAKGRQLFVPAGFAHGFCTLEPDTEVLYKVSAPYAASHDRGLAWNDPALAIPWPVTADEAILSDRDQHHPRLAELDSPFG